MENGHAHSCKDNLVKEKQGFRCSLCGKFHPFLTISYKGREIDPQSLSKWKPKAKRYRKAAVLFGDRHYWAQCKKSLLKMEYSPDGTTRQTAEVPIPGSTYHVAMSPESTYLGAETFGGTLSLIHVPSGKVMARKRQCKVNGAFLLEGSGALLYFREGQIRRWFFLRDEEETLWQTPEGASWVCTTVIGLPGRAFLFQCMEGARAHMVMVRGSTVKEIASIPEVPLLCRLVYSEEAGVFTLISGGKVCFYDETFRQIEAFDYPTLEKYADGGGVFPVTKFAALHSQGVYVSGDRKWILLDYFTAAILMRHEDYALRFCLFSYTGKTVGGLGFPDSRHFRYTWGDTTYVHEIGEDADSGPEK